MANPSRVYAFDALAAAVQTAPLATPGVALTPRHPGAIYNLRGNARDADFLREASAAFDVGLPIPPNTAMGADGIRALWLGPDEWLIVSAREVAGVPSARMAKGTVTDLSHGLAILRLSGADTRAALAKGCLLDLDRRQFPINACAQTAIVKINIVLDHVAPDVFDLYCPRSYAGSLWHWMTEAAAEYGLEVALPA